MLLLECTPLLGSKRLVSLAYPPGQNALEKKRPLTRAKKGPNSPNVLQTIIFFVQDDWATVAQQFCSVKIIVCNQLSAQEVIFALVRGRHFFLAPYNVGNVAISDADV